MIFNGNKTASGFLCEIVVMRMHSKASENYSRFEVKRIKSGSFKYLWFTQYAYKSTLVMKKKLVFLHRGRKRCR